MAASQSKAFNLKVSVAAPGITSFPLPTSSGSTYGVDYYGFPYLTNGSSKHTNMAACPLNNRLYVSGGDTIHSATDGTWSMDLADGSWRLDVGLPIHPSLPAPHAAQDGMGFYWMPSRQKFVFWPGSYYPYEPEGTPVLEYAKGLWMFDPMTNIWTQHLELFGKKGETSGCLFGGVYDELTDAIYVFGDSGSATAVRRWHLGSLTRLPDLPFTIANKPAGYPAAYFTRSQYAKLDRHIYIVGAFSDGTNTIPALWRWHLDNQTWEERARPPTAMSVARDLETRLGVSNGKLVWPTMTGPEGDFAMGILVYDPVADVWMADTQVPSYGNFIANAVTSLPDGRVAMCGGSFGKAQTHMWFYTAAP